MSLRRLFVASGNRGKLRELRRLTEGVLQIVTPGEVGRPLPEVVEDGVTFEENARKKAVAFARFSGLPALADDSGLCVDALGGAPGVHSARWSDLRADRLVSPACALAEVAERELARADRDERNNDQLLASLSGVPEAERGAAYVAVVVVAAPDGSVVAQSEGRCRGRIGYVRRGSMGFGYDPLFVPLPAKAPGAEPAATPGAPEAASARTMAELSPEEKDALSHRGRALRALVAELERVGALGAASRRL